MPPKYRKRVQELCSERNVAYDALMSDKQGRILAYHRRHIILQFSEEFPHLSLHQVGQIFNRDHSTIVGAKKRAKDERTNGVTSWLRSYLGTQDLN
jgi:chromosomal replication initiation ATPase DnaA